MVSPKKLRDNELFLEYTDSMARLYTQENEHDKGKPFEDVSPTKNGDFLLL